MACNLSLTYDLVTEASLKVLRYEYVGRGKIIWCEFVAEPHV